MESAGELVKSRVWRRRLTRGARRLGGALLDLLYSPVCLACDAPTALPDGLCADCFRALRPITAPLCPRLGLPFAADPGPGALSLEALRDPPPFARARSALVYNEMASGIVARLKYGDRPELARFCARLMAGAGHELWADAPVLVPVPLHSARLRQRRYNQAAELAQALAQITGLTVDPHLLRRHRHTRQQVGLSGDGRRRNVAGAFVAHADSLRRAGGRRIVLVDDVYTTGATIGSATRSLLKAGVAGVDAISFARVVIGADLPI